jgi:hypothetical protein
MGPKRKSLKLREAASIASVASGNGRRVMPFKNAVIFCLSVATCMDTNSIYRKASISVYA